MITVSNDYLSKLNSNSLLARCKIVVDNTVYLSNVIKTMPKISHKATKLMGCFPAKIATFEMINSNNDIDFKDKEITIYKGISINGTIKYVKQGVFIPRSNDISTNISNNTISFNSIMDKSQLLDNIYESELVWNNNQTHTGLEIVQEICTKRNITLLTTNFAFASYQFPKPNFVENITEREVIARLAEIGGEIAIFNNEGQLVIKGQTNTSQTIARNRYQKVTEETSITYNSVALGNENIDNDIVYPTSINGSRVTYRIEDNPYVDLIKEDIIEDVANYIIGFTYVPFSLTNFTDGYMFELNDVINILDRNNNTVRALILEIENTSRIKSDIALPNNFSIIDSTNYSLAGSNKNGLAQVKLEVDHNKQEIRALAQDTIKVFNKLKHRNNITLNNAYNGRLYKLSIKGQIILLFPTINQNYGFPLVPSNDLLPSNTLVPSSPVPYNNESLYPSSTLYPKSNCLLVDNEKYYLDLDFLNYISDSCCDEFIYEDGKCWIIRRVGINSNNEMYSLDNEIIEYRKDIDIYVDSNSIISLESFSNIDFEVEYLLNNEYTDVFAKDVEVKSAINQKASEIDISVNQKLSNYSNTTEMNAAINLKANEINQTVSQKVGQDEVISSINQTSEIIKILASKLALEGLTTINGNFTIDLYGNMSCMNATINGDLVTANGVLTNLQFPCEMWGWNRQNVYDYQGGGFVGFNYNYDGYGNISVHKSFLNFTVHIPSGFTIKSAKIHLRHSPVVWYDGNGSNTQRGSCQNIKAFIVSNLGTIGYGAYYSEYEITGSANFTSLISQVSAHTFGNNYFEEYTTEDFKNIFTNSGTYNIALINDNSTPALYNPDSAYSVLGSQTGVLNGFLEIIGYTKNV